MKLFFGELNTKALLNDKEKIPTTNNFNHKLIQFVTLLTRIDGQPLCFTSLLSTTFAIFFTKVFGIALLNENINGNDIGQSCIKRKVLTIVFDFVIARANLFRLSPVLEVYDMESVYGPPTECPSSDDQLYLKNLSKYRQLWRQLRAPNNGHRLMINSVHYKGESLLHYSCTQNMLESTTFLIDECQFDCDKVFHAKVGSAFNKSRGVVQDLLQKHKLFGSNFKATRTISDDIQNIQQQEIDIQYMLLSMGISCNGFQSNVNTSTCNKNNDEKLNHDTKITFKRTNIAGDIVVNGLHDMLLNLIDCHMQWNDFMWNFIFKYLCQCKHYENVNEKYHDLSVLILKTISMILSLSISHLKSEEDLFRHKYQKSKALLSVLDINTLKYIKNTLINTQDCKVYLSDHCDERIGDLFKNHLKILVNEMIQDIPGAKVYPSVSDLLAKLSSVLQQESQKGLYEDILHDTQIYRYDWYEIRGFGDGFNNDGDKLSQSMYSNYSRINNSKNEDDENKNDTASIEKHHSRGGSLKIAQALAGDDSIRPFTTAQEIKLQQLHKTAGELNEAFHQTMEAFCNQFLRDDLVVYHRGPIKTQDRIRDKLESKPNSDIDNVLDINRGTVDCFSLPQLNYALKQFVKFVGNHKSGMIKIVRIKNTTKNWLKDDKKNKVKYGDIKCNVLFQYNKKTIIGEVQFNLRQIINFQRKIHHFYEMQRLKSVFDPTKIMCTVYKLDNKQEYQRYNNSIIQASNKRAFCNSFMYSPTKLCQLCVKEDYRSETFLKYLGKNCKSQKQIDMLELGLDYLLYFNKHCSFGYPEYISNYLCKKSFYNEPFHRNTAFGINCADMKDNSKKYNIVKHILDSIVIPDDIFIDMDRICKEPCDLSQLYLLWCKYLHHNQAIRQEILSFDFLGTIKSYQGDFIMPGTFFLVKQQVELTFGLPSA